MTTWIVIAVIVGLLGVGGGMRVLLRSKEDRLARRELRRLRRDRRPDLRGAAEHRHNMMMDPMPGKDSFPLGP